MAMDLTKGLYLGFLRIGEIEVEAEYSDIFSYHTSSSFEILLGNEKRVTSSYFSRESLII